MNVSDLLIEKLFWIPLGLWFHPQVPAAIAPRFLCETSAESTLGGKPPGRRTRPENFLAETFSYLIRTMTKLMLDEKKSLNDVQSAQRIGLFDLLNECFRYLRALVPSTPSRKP